MCVRVCLCVCEHSAAHPEFKGLYHRGALGSPAAQALLVPSHHDPPTLFSPPGCMVEGRTFSPAESDTKNANGIIHRQKVK